MNDFLTRLKFVTIRDFLALLPMIVGMMLAPFVKLRHPHLWLVCERHNEARDNGYWLFKFLCESKPTIDTIYVIDCDCVDYKKIERLGKSIRWGTILHWAYYFAAQYNISTQKDGNPRAAICFMLENYLHIDNHRIFLQHGITQNNVSWLNYKITHFRLFCCAVKREYEYVCRQLGYSEQNTCLVGFCRYDNLLKRNHPKRQILVMPTWRNWLGRISSDTRKFEKSTNFTDSEYYNTWNTFLNSEKLQSILVESNCDLIFYPHSNLQKYIETFRVPANARIVIADAEHYDVQQLLIESAALITDYSSIFFDFAYMNKPMAYYQFDYEKFRAGQYQEGYFSYHNDGFGPDIHTENELLKWIQTTINTNFIQTEQYKQRVSAFFMFHDTDNCARTFNTIQQC